MNQADAKQGGTLDPAHWVILVAGVVYAVGVALLAVAVYVDLPGPLAAYGDPEASWPVGMQVVAGLLAFGTWRFVNRRNNRPFAVVLLALGILTVLILASASYGACPDGGLSRGWNVVTRVVGLLTNNFAVEMFEEPGCETDGVPLALQFARLAQLIVLLVAATSAVTALLRNQIDRIAVRLAPRVSLMLGVDEESSSLLVTLADNRPARSVLALITEDPLAPWLATARRSGWRVVIGDAMNAQTLRRLLARPGRRHSLVHLAVLASESVGAIRQLTLVEEVLEGRLSKPVPALLRIDDAWQAEDWRRRSNFGRGQGWIIDTISRTEETARLLIDDLVARHCDVVIVTGHSDLTYAILPELAQQERERRVTFGTTAPQVVLNNPMAHEIVADHEASSKSFGIVSWLSITIGEHDLEQLVSDEQGRGRRVAVVMTDEPNSGDQRLATRLGSKFDDASIYVSYAGVKGLATEPLLASVRAFGSTLDIGSGVLGRWTRLAAAVHNDFVRSYPAPDDPARRPWGQLSPFYRESNVRQVMAVLASAVAVGRSWAASSETATPVSDAQLDEMARREHESWMEFLQSNGWTWAAQRDRAAKKHPDLLAWHKLSDEARQKTRKGVTETLALLETLGYRSFDDPFATWVRFRRTGQVTAVRRDEPWTWETGDGTVMHGKAGDWEVIDESGSRSVDAAVFEKTHEALGGDRWRRVGEIRGRQARPGEVVHSLEGDQTARHGQWVLSGVAGEEWLVSTEHLETSYERVGHDSSAL